MIERIKSRIRQGCHPHSLQQGQGLTELAIAFPIFLLIFLGLAEVGAALHSYQIVVNAAREGARYGVKVANARSGFGFADASDETIAQWAWSAANSLPITTVPGDDGETLVIDGEKATVIVTRLRKTYSPTKGYVYQILNQYSEGGERPSVITEEWLAETARQDDDIKALFAGLPNETDEELAVEVIYEHPQLTGLFSIILPDPVPMQSMTIMRLSGNEIPQCDAYPIALHQSSLSGVSQGQSIGDIWNGSGAGNFGWLRWPADQSAGNEGYLVDSLTDPSLSLVDFSNAQDPSDTILNTGDYVWGNTGVSNSSGVRAALDSLEGKKIRVLVWDTASGTGINGYYHIVGFAWITMTDYHLPGQDRITATFQGWDTSCTVMEN